MVGMDRNQRLVLSVQSGPGLSLVINAEIRWRPV
jgi:hypothetical protein